MALPGDASYNNKEERLNNFFTSTRKPFPDLKDGKIDTEQFLDASRGVITLVDKFGKVFAPVKYDMSGNVEKITKRYQLDMAQNSTLQDLVLVEQAEGLNIATDALMWLTRALHFVETFLEKILETHHEEVSENLKSELTHAYVVSLKRYHGWMSQQLFMLVCRMCPARTQFFASLGNDANTDFFGDMAIFHKNLRINRQEIHRFYAAHNLESDLVV